MSNSERGEQAKVYKEKGTNYFKKANYPLAIKMYKKSIDVLPEISKEFLNKTYYWLGFLILCS